MIKLLIAFLIVAVVAAVITMVAMEIGRAYGRHSRLEDSRLPRINIPQFNKTDKKD